MNGELGAVNGGGRGVEGGLWDRDIDWRGGGGAGRAVLPSLCMHPIVECPPFLHTTSFFFFSFPPSSHSNAPHRTESVAPPPFLWPARDR